MPFRSQAQAKWAFATKQPWARKWGHKTRLAGGIDKLPQYVTRKNRKWGLRRLKSQTSFKETQGHTSAMVAVYLSMEAACGIHQASVDLFGEKAENIGDLHITLAYLGKMADIEDKVHELVPAIQRYTQKWLELVGVPLTAILGRYDYFDNPQDDENAGMFPVYRSVESPLLMMWVEGLDRVLENTGVPASREYGPYTPHVTVAYTYPEIARIVRIAPVTRQPVQFDHIVIALGDLQIDLPLAVSTYKSLPITIKAATQIAPGVYKIRGNLCQVKGKFGPCDGASSEGFGKKPKGKKGGKGKGAGKKPKLTDAEKKAKRDQDKEARKVETEAAKVQNRAESLAKLSKRPNDAAMAALDAMRSGGVPDEAMAKSMEATGLVSKHADGSYTLSPNGHSFLDALEKGDPGKANEALSKGGDQTAAASARSEAQLKRIADHQAKIEERNALKKQKDESRKKTANAPGSKGHSSGDSKRHSNAKHSSHDNEDEEVSPEEDGNTYAHPKNRSRPRLDPVHVRDRSGKHTPTTPNKHHAAAAAQPVSPPSRIEEEKKPSRVVESTAERLKRQRQKA